MGGGGRGNPTHPRPAPRSGFVPIKRLRRLSIRIIYYQNVRLGFQRGLYARWRRRDTRREHSEGRGTMAQSEDARCRPTRGWKLRRRGGLRARERRCCFKIQDHKDSTLGETRLAHASGDDLGRGLRRVGANEPTVAHGSPLSPPTPTSPPGCSGRQITEEGESLTVVLTGT